jgi:hypothetical protein
MAHEEPTRAGAAIVPTRKLADFRRTSGAHRDLPVADGTPSLLAPITPRRRWWPRGAGIAGGRRWTGGAQGGRPRRRHAVGRRQGLGVRRRDGGGGNRRARRRPTIHGRRRRGITGSDRRDHQGGTRELRERSGAGEGARGGELRPAKHAGGAAAVAAAGGTDDEGHASEQTATERPRQRHPRRLREPIRREWNCAGPRNVRP